MRYGKSMFLLCGIEAIRQITHEQLVGMGGHSVVIDDPHAEFEADVERMVQSARAFSREALVTPSRGPQPRTKYPRRR